MGLAVGVEEGQAVETLVVLREAAEAEEESPNTHLHQHPPLVTSLSREGLGHLHHLWWRLWPPLPLTGWSLRGGLVRGGRLGRGGRDRQWIRTWIRTGLRKGGFRQSH